MLKAIIKVYLMFFLICIVFELIASWLLNYWDLRTFIGVVLITTFAGAAYGWPLFARLVCREADKNDRDGEN